MFKRIIQIFLLLHFCLALPEHSRGQILDDTTRQVYGPKTTGYITEADIYAGKDSIHPIDTLVYGFHQYYPTWNPWNIRQDQGNLGTPSNPVYYTPPTLIGKSYGFNAFNPYAFDPNTINYYDTRSPFASVYYMQGSRGQQFIDVEYSRNVHSRWNTGFRFRTTNAQKQIGAATRRDPQTRTYAFTLYSRYFSKNKNYQVLGNLTVFDATNYETGGVRPSYIDSYGNRSRDSLFHYQDEVVWLYAARSLEKRFNLHLYHEYAPAGIQAFKIFHVADFVQRQNRFTDALHRNTTTGDTIRLFQGPLDNWYNDQHLLPGLVDKNRTADKTSYGLVENKAGIKGRADKFSYVGYYKLRNFYFDQKVQKGDTSVLKSDTTYTEQYLGGNINYFISDSSSLNASAEYLLLSRYYFIKADYHNRFFEAGYLGMWYSPSLVQQRYLSNHFSWKEGWKGTRFDQVYAGVNVHWKTLQIKPKVQAYNFTSYVYFDASAMPRQENNPFQLYQADLEVKFRFHKFHLENLVRYSVVKGSNVIRVPELYNFSRVYFANHLFKGKPMYLMAGVDFFWRSTYYANYYMPVDQQFYFNNTLPVQAYPLFDVFLDIDVGRVNFFLKVGHANQGLMAKNGYFSTPRYPGLRRSIDFGIKWMFFD